MILITGGAGYIGSHVNKMLNQQGYETIIIDNLSNGYEKNVKWGTFIKGDIGDYDTLKSLFQKYNIEAVMHLAAFALVSESIENPQLYHKNNYEKTLNLLKVMKEENVKYFIFSSTCTLYGNTKEIPITENNKLNPINPYGKSKLLVEKELKKESDNGNIKYVSLRYFNAAGADIDNELGEEHNPETHIIPLVLNVAIKKQKNITVYGNDYNTADGSCVRDYVHVMDIAQAHIKSLEYLKTNNKSNIFNLGTGKGTSVKEIIKSVEKITNKKIPTIIGNRRKGDPDILIADPSKAFQILKWKPQYSDLNDIIKTAWTWHKKL